MRDKKKREELKKGYTEAYYAYLKEHPDMPLRKNYKTKKEFREDKNIWIEEHTDMGDYIRGRFGDLILLHPELAALYTRNYPQYFHKQPEQLSINLVERI